MKSVKLRKLFEREEVIRVVGAHDGLGARLIEHHGFDCVWASGFEISTSYAVADASLLTMSQYLERAREMNSAASIPVIADCDTGFGGRKAVARMVKRYEQAGIAAVCIEDKRIPKVNSLLPGGVHKLATVDEFVEKIKVAKNNQKSKEFMVIARIEAFIAGFGCEEAIKRADAYVEAGADAILIHSKSRTPSQIRQFCQQWSHKVPVAVIPTAYPALTVKEAKELGVNMIIYANQGIRSAIRSINDVLSQIKKNGRTHELENRIVPIEFVFDLFSK